MIKFTTEFKVGAFALAILILLGWATMRVGDKTSVHGGGYLLKVKFDNATGLKLKAPVELAGVQIGVVKDIELVDSRNAMVSLILSDKVRLTEDSTAVLRTRGFLGETYVEVMPGTPDLPLLGRDGTIPNSFRTGDMNSLVNQFNEIAADIKQVTGSLKTMVGDDESAPINRIVNNLDQFTETIKTLALANSENVNRISANLAELSEHLREVMAQGKADVEESMQRIASITRKIDEGQGTVGRLINDDETVDKLNEAVDNLNQTLGGFKRFETEIGYHLEYLTQSEDFKNYVDFTIRPSPDAAFILGLVSDPNPNPTHVTRTTDVTVGNNTTTVTTDTATVNRNALRVSAQLAKKFYDFQVRGGIIESTGGLGIDYDKGPIGLRFSAYDFQTRYGTRPHLRLTGEVKVTDNFYLLGGADDMIAQQNRPDFFFGAGFRFVDEHIKRVAPLGASVIR
ncbi:MAG: MCE family protein [Proteobacteria bacterium]|nr:MCE family protein [Pseudomonadota bacterium]